MGRVLGSHSLKVLFFFKYAALPIFHYRSFVHSLYVFSMRHFPDHAIFREKSVTSGLVGKAWGFLSLIVKSFKKV